MPLHTKRIIWYLGDHPITSSHQQQPMTQLTNQSTLWAVFDCAQWMAFSSELRSVRAHGEYNYRYLMVALTFFHTLNAVKTVHYWTTFASKYGPKTQHKSYFRVFHFADYTVLHAHVVHGHLQNMLISTDQSQSVSQPVSQITLSQFRVSHFTDYP